MAFQIVLIFLKRIFLQNRTSIYLRAISNLFQDSNPDRHTYCYGGIKELGTLKKSQCLLYIKFN